MKGIYFLGIVLLLLVSCTEDPDAEKMELYLALQENLVDMQADVTIHQEDLADLSYVNNYLEVLSDIEQSKEPINERHTFEMPSPKDRISHEQIAVQSRKVILYVDNVVLGQLLDTNSMDPLMDAGSNTLAIQPEGPEDIDEGDIILFKSDLSEHNIIHRVKYVGEDEDGTYYITQGDNNPTVDPGKVRFENITSVIIGIIY